MAELRADLKATIAPVKLETPVKPEALARQTRPYNANSLANN